MNEDIKEILKQLEQAYTNSACLEPEKAKRYYDAISNLEHNWNELKNLLIKKMNEYVTYQGDLSIIYEEIFDEVVKLEERGNNE